MYKSVLFTDKEIYLLRNIVSDFLSRNVTSEDVNLTIILNRLRDKNPQESYVNNNDLGRFPTNQ
jgi:hypothetical protein